MNGFEAMRAIRDTEAARNMEDSTVRAANAVALTGLTSERDQVEAMASGMDLFLTKPISFKKVGKLLDL